MLVVFPRLIISSPIPMFYRMMLINITLKKFGVYLILI